MTSNLSIQQFNLREGYGVLAKSNYQTRLHSHFAIEAVYCPDGCFDIYTEDAAYTNLKAVLIPPGLPHRFRCTDAKCELLFVDPLSRLGQFVTERYRLHGMIVDPQQIRTLFMQPYESRYPMPGMKWMTWLQRVTG